MINIRDMKTSDHGGVRDHLAMCWQDTYAHLLEPYDLAKMISSLDAYDLGLLTQDCVALVAIDTADVQKNNAPENRIVGTAIAAERDGIGYVWGMYVATDQKRRGIGRSLIKEISARLPYAKCLSVIVVRASREAEAFYNAQGFALAQHCKHELASGSEHKASRLVLNKPCVELV